MVTVPRHMKFLPLISLQYKKETGNEFNLNDIIEWCEKRMTIDIDDEIVKKFPHLL